MFLLLFSATAYSANFHRPGYRKTHCGRHRNARHYLTEWRAGSSHDAISMTFMASIGGMNCHWRSARQEGCEMIRLVFVLSPIGRGFVIQSEARIEIFSGALTAI